MTDLGKAIDYITNKIADLEDDLSHEENVEHDKARAYFIKCDIEEFKNVIECLYELQRTSQSEHQS